MADNTTLNSGSGGDVVRSIQKGTPKTSVVVLDVGGSGSESLLGSGASTLPISGTITVGAVPANPFGLNADAADPSGSYSAKLAYVCNTQLSSATSLAAIDDWDESDRAKVNVIVGQAGVAGGSGAVSAATQRVCLATDVALPAGTNNIGDVDVLTLPALPAGTNNIGDVDVLSIAAGDNNIGNVDIVSVPAPLSTTGGGTEATALRVTIATDSTGVVSIDDNGGSLTVDGTVTANAGTNLNTSALALEAGGNLAAAATALAIVDDWDESDRAKVNPIAGQAGVAGGSGTVSSLTQRVVLATDVALPAGTNGIGKLTANSGVDIGDVDVTSISAGSNLIGDVGLQGRASGGLDIFRSLDIDESEEEVKATAGTLYWVHAVNLTASKRYLKFYNATAANTTVGTTTPVLTLVIPTAGDTNGCGFLFAVPQGLAFSTAISVACTTGLADADTSAPGANDVVINIGYK